jgi:hypothetical protein
MNLRAAARVLTVCGVVVCAASEAAAQAPVLSVTAAGTRVTIEWTPLPGALGYNAQVGSTPGANDIVSSINLPASITRIVVDAPAGTYYLRIRGFAHNVVGPFSNEASITIGTSTPPPAPPPPPSSPCDITAPAVTTVVGGPTVGVSWTPVPGTIGYRIEFSYTPDGVDLVQTVGPNATWFSQYVGIVGTFYVRVVAGNQCRIVASETLSFSITDLNGTGPRTPDPPAGQRLPLPSYGLSVVQRIAAQYPGDLFNSCVEHGGTNAFMYRVLQALRRYDPRWGLNWKRGNRGDLSQDIVTYHFGPGPDEDSIDVYIIDIIGGHCGSRPYPVWIDQTEATRAGGTIGRWTLQPYLTAGFPPDPRQ